MDSGSDSYRRFLEGDESGLVEIIRDYKDGLILYLCGIVGSLPVAEELAEDTFVKLGIRKPRDKGKSSFKTWLYTIGRHTAIDHLRRQRRRTALSLEACLDMADEQESLENTYLREERRITVHRAMGRLKPEYRQVLWLAYFEDFSYKEIAAVMKRTPHSIETMAYRARQVLRKELEKEGFVYEEL